MSMICAPGGTRAASMLNDNTACMKDAIINHSDMNKTCTDSCMMTLCPPKTCVIASIAAMLMSVVS